MTIINMSGGRAGKTPVYQARSIIPVEFPTTIQPQEGYDALSQVTVQTPSNLLPQNIRKDVNIAGVIGTYEATAPTISLQQKTVTPSTSPQIVKADEGYDGLSQVQVVGSNNLTAGNIKSGVNIFGVVGTYTGPTIRTQQRSVKPTYFPYTVEPQGGYDYLDSVVVSAPTNLSAGNIRSGVTIAGVTGTYTGVAPNPSSYTRDYSSSATAFSNYPKIIVGSTYSLSTGIGVGHPAFITTGNVIEEDYQSGYYYHGTGGSCVSSQAFSPFNQNADCVGCDISSWSNTNRDSSSMDDYLDQVSGRLGEDYFSGTLECYVGALVMYADGSGDIMESGAMSSQSSSGTSTSPNTYYRRNVPFTYSNGNVTYTLSTSSTGALGVRPARVQFLSAQNWSNPTTEYNVRLCLYFHDLFIKV